MKTLHLAPVNLFFTWVVHREFDGAKLCKRPSPAAVSPQRLPRMFGHDLEVFSRPLNSVEGFCHRL